MSLNSDYQKLYVDGLITLFELDASALGAGILRFHGHIAFQDWEKIYSSIGSDGLIGSDSDLIGKVFDVGTDKVWQRNIIWQGKTFSAMAIQADGMEMNSTGRASSPTLSMANNIDGLQNAVSAYCLQFNDFAGARLTVISTLAKYIDAENFSQGNPTASNEAENQLWFIEQKTSENMEQVTFELSNPIDFEGQRIPIRQVSSQCHWCMMGDYRGEECGYTGAAMFTEKNEPTDNPALDKCGGRLSSCKVRKNEGSFGGQPAANMIG
ncbi:phage minor tail protein L [Acinetobacter sp. TAC-1]|uniref:phage minor tail protein L n=1 Tax=Acinetobacter sp. TAC-1 TaxID=3027470 RepID=UPI0023AA7783|nr:phage minor tail protein L [Acinetobacter sp. TAC-1]WEE38329.1 phage minor tail protein L [Acinetobacter sp. TAC-1]